MINTLFCMVTIMVRLMGKGQGEDSFMIEEIEKE